MPLVVVREGFWMVWPIGQLRLCCQKVSSMLASLSHVYKISNHIIDASDFIYGHIFSIYICQIFCVYMQCAGHTCVWHIFTSIM